LLSWPGFKERQIGTLFASDFLDDLAVLVDEDDLFDAVGGLPDFDSSHWPVLWEFEGMVHV